MGASVRVDERRKVHPARPVRPQPGDASGLVRRPDRRGAALVRPEPAKEATFFVTRGIYLCSSISPVNVLLSNSTE